MNIKINNFIDNLRNFPEISRAFFRKLTGELTIKERIIILLLGLLFFGAASWILIGFYINKTKITPAYGGTYIEGMVGTPENINPVIPQNNEADLNLTKMIFSGLMRYDQDNNLVEDVAESWSRSEDGKVYTVKVRKDVKFHDGEALTADDVVFTLNIIQNNRYNSKLRFNWADIKVEALNEYEVQFTLKQPFTPFLHNLTFGILPKHRWEDVGPETFQLSKYNKSPIGSGPYLFDRSELNSNETISQIVLKANKEYHLGRPYIETVLLKFYSNEEAAIEALNNGDILAINNLDNENYDLVNQENVNIYEISWPHYYAVFFNVHGSKIMGRDEVREALAWATCKNEILEQVLESKGKIVDSPVLNVSMENVEDFEKRDCSIEKAKEVLEDEGWKLKKYSPDNEDSEEEDEESDNDEEGDEDGEEEGSDEDEDKDEAGGRKVYVDKNGNPLKFKFYTFSDVPKIIETAELVKKQWEKAGILIDLQVLSAVDLKNQHIDSRDYDALLFGEILEVDPDPRPYWHSSQANETGQNLSNYKNKEVDDLLDAGRKETDIEKRTEIYQKFQLLLNKDVPAVFLYSAYYLYPVNEKVKGIKIESIGDSPERYRSIHKWYLKEQRTKE